MRQHEKQEDMSLPQILEDIHDRICDEYCKSCHGYLQESVEDIHDRICDEYCKWPSQYPLATDDEAYNRMGEEHCDKCPVRRLT